MGCNASVAATTSNTGATNIKNQPLSDSSNTPLSLPRRISAQSQKFQRSLSFSVGKIVSAQPSPVAISPEKAPFADSVKPSNTEATLPQVSLFGDLYKVKASNGSLEQVCPDEKVKIYLVTPMDEEPDTTTKKRNNSGTKKNSRILSDEPEEMSDAEAPSTPLRFRSSPVPSIDVSPENIQNAAHWISSQSIKYAPQTASQKASLYESASRSVSRTASQSQSQSVIAAMEAGNARRVTLRKDNTFHGDTGNGIPRESSSLRKVITVHQTQNIAAAPKSKRRDELEKEFENWANENVDHNNDQLDDQENIQFQV